MSGAVLVCLALVGAEAALSASAMLTGRDLAPEVAVRVVMPPQPVLLTGGVRPAWTLAALLTLLVLCPSPIRFVSRLVVESPRLSHRRIEALVRLRRKIGNAYRAGGLYGP